MAYRFSIFLVSLMICILVLQGCSETKVSPETEVDTDHSKDKPSFVFRNMVSLYSENGIIRIRRSTPLMYRYDNGDERYPEGLDITLYDEKGKKTTTLVSKSGSYNEGKKTYQAVGDVVVINTDKMQRLETPILNWTQESQEIFTDTTVVITTESEQLNGIGLFARHDFSEYRVVEATGIVTVDGIGNGAFKQDDSDDKISLAQTRAQQGTTQPMKKGGAKGGGNKAAAVKGKGGNRAAAAKGKGGQKGKKQPVKKKTTKEGG